MFHKNLNLVEVVLPFIDNIDIEKVIDDQAFIDFFHKFIDDENNLSQKEIIEISQDKHNNIEHQLCFNMAEANFFIEFSKSSMTHINSEKKIFQKIDSHFILHINDNDESDQRPFLPGLTLRNLLERNYFNHIITDVDKLVWALQILIAMSDIYEENSNNPKNESINYGKISDESFYIDSMKNIYLFSFPEISDHKVQRNIKNKMADFVSIGKILDSIFKEKTLESHLYSNNGFYWYRNYHMIIDKVLNKFTITDDEVPNFQDIINEIKKTELFEENQNEINLRLNESQFISTSTKCSFNDLVLAQLGGLNDINPICSRLFCKLRDQSKEGSDYFLLFNLILHIFFPSYNRNGRRIEYIEFINIFKENDVKTMIEKLLKTNLPSNDQFQEMIKAFDIERSLLNNSLAEMIKNQLKQYCHKETYFHEVIKTLANYYFPNTNEQVLNDCNAFDYFGIIEFLIQKDDILYLTYPTMSKENFKRLSEMPTYEKMKDFFKSSFEDITFYRNIFILNNVDGFDSLLISHQLFFNVTDASFYLERKYLHDELDQKFKEKVLFQDEIFSNVTNSKYIIHLNQNINQIKYYENVSISLIPFLSSTLYNFILRNSKNHIITDTDKILWAIQMAIAFRDLDSYSKQNNSIDFIDCISDHSFYIDEMKNIYLCSLAFCNERENDMSTTFGPFYFRSNSHRSYIYAYGVLLNEIITEMEPKTMFGNMSRRQRNEYTKNGYAKFNLFNEYGEKWYNKYGQDIKEIVYKCIDVSFINFTQIIDELKETKLYKMNQYIVDKREMNAKPIDSSRKFSFHSIMLVEITGINEMKCILNRFFEDLSVKYSQDDEHQILYENILNEIKSSNSTKNYFNAFKLLTKKF